MRKFVLGLAIAALASVSPALAGDKQSKKVDESGSASMQKSAHEGRGGLKEWPVSKEAADWSSAAPGSATTGESTGASGSDTDSGSSNR
jgi:hypothetical protein